MIRSRIGELLRVSKYRREFILNQLGVSKNTLSNWVSGKTYPTADKMYILADLLDVKVDDLYERNHPDNISDRRRKSSAERELPSKKKET